jgi:preprotein translocase subunit SecG
MMGGSGVRLKIVRRYCNNLYRMTIGITVMLFSLSIILGYLS